jgi:trans-aconitate methyltransferase
MAEDHPSSAATTDLKANVERFMGFADVYDAARPTPPADLVDLLLRYAGRTRAACVADIGCGTGTTSKAAHARHGTTRHALHTTHATPPPLT